MAKGDVVMRFDGETADLVQKLLKVRQEIEASADSARHFGEAGDEAGGKMHSAFGRAGEKAEELTKKMTGVAVASDLIEKGFEAAAQTAESFFDRVEQKAQQYKQKMDTLFPALADTGKGGDAGQVREFVENLGSQKIGAMMVSPDAAMASAAAIARAVPRASTADVERATVVAQGFRATGGSAEVANQVGITYAQLQGIDLHGRSAEDVAFALRGIDPAELKMLQRGVPVDLIRAARQTDQGGKALGGLLSEADEDINVPGLQLQRRKEGRFFSADNARKLELGQYPAGDKRLAALLKDPSLASSETSRLVSLLQRGAGQLGPIPAAQSVIDQAAGNPALGEMFSANNTDTTLERAKATGEKQSFGFMERVKMGQALFEKEHPLLSNIKMNVPMLGEFQLSRASGYQDAATSYLSNAKYDELRARTVGAETSPGHSMSPEDRQEAIQHQKAARAASGGDMSALLQSIDRSLKEMNNKMDSNPNLNNNSEGQK